VTQLRERLEVLEQTLAAVGAPLLDHLRPGASADAVTGALASRGIGWAASDGSHSLLLAEQLGHCRPQT
jgi:hypothetical protein